MNKFLAAAAAALLAAAQASATTVLNSRDTFDALGRGSAFFTDLDNQGSTAPLPFGFGPLTFSGSFGTAFYWASDWHENAPGVNGNVDGTAWVQMRLNTFNGAVTISSSAGFQALGFDLRPYFDASGNADGGETVLFSTDTGESGSFRLPTTNAVAFLGLVFDAPVQSVSFGIGNDHVNGFTWFGVDNLQTYASVSAVPEPASVALLLAGLGSVGMAARRRRTG